MVAEVSRRSDPVAQVIFLDRFLYARRISSGEAELSNPSSS